MEKDWIDDCLTSYYKWLKDKTTHQFDEMTGWALITTPYVGIFNDLIEIYAKKEGSSILLSDDGATLRNLQLAGVSLSRSQNRRDILEATLRNFGIAESNNGELLVQATMETFAQKKHNLLSAMMELSELQVLADTKMVSCFREDVRSYLDEQGLIFTPQFIAKGKTGLDFSFDFQVAHRTSEYVIKSFNTLNKSNISNFLFGWDDVRVIRKEASRKELQGVAIVNDIDMDVKPDMVNALINRDAKVVYWSQRDQLIPMLKDAA